MTTVREGWFRETYAGRQWMASDKMAASKQSVRVRCVVVTGRTAADVRLALDILDARDRIFPGARADREAPRA